MLDALKIYDIESSLLKGYWLWMTKFYDPCGSGHKCKMSPLIHEKYMSVWKMKIWERRKWCEKISMNELKHLTVASLLVDDAVLVNM